MGQPVERLRKLGDFANRFNCETVRQNIPEFCDVGWIGYEVSDMGYRLEFSVRVGFNHLEDTQKSVIHKLCKRLEKKKQDKFYGFLLELNKRILENNEMYESCATNKGK
jgi:hypothetical protein